MILYVPLCLVSNINYRKFNIDVEQHNTDLYSSISMRRVDANIPPFPDWDLDLFFFKPKHVDGKITKQNFAKNISFEVPDVFSLPGWGTGVEKKTCHKMRLLAKSVVVPRTK